ncbi:MAG: hypothetical protein ACI9G1_003168, partial [Pirellulaceae bacterium]
CDTTCHTNLIPVARCQIVPIRLIEALASRIYAENADEDSNIREMSWKFAATDIVVLQREAR